MRVDGPHSLLRWERDRGGVALLGPVIVQLPVHRHDVEGLPDDLVLIEHAPDSRVWQLQPFNDRKRDMQRHEREACDRYLRRVCALEGVNDGRD